MSHPLLSAYGYFDPQNEKKFVAAIFILDRILIADEQTVKQEWDQFKKTAAELSAAFNVQADDFFEELKRQFQILKKFNLSDGQLLRLTREAIEVVEEEFSPTLKKKFLNACKHLILSDAYIHKRELMILYDLTTVCTESINDLRSFFQDLQMECKKKFQEDHPVNEILTEMLSIVKRSSPKARMALIQRPDEVREALIPPLSFTYEEFADWITTVSFLRAAQHREAPLNHTRTNYSIGNMTAQKGLIKLVSVVDEDDEQLTEAHDFTKKWCAAVRDNKGNFPFPDQTIFSICIFGSNGDNFTDCCLPNQNTPGLWYITCIKQSQTIEVHAFDISGDNPPTYWCPEMADKLSVQLNIPQNLVDGNYPLDEAGRLKILEKSIKLFSN